MGMAEGIWRIKGVWEALSVQYREIAEEEGIVREKGRKPYLEVWEIAALLELAAAFEIPATTLAQMIIGPHIRSYHIFRKDRIEKAYRLLRIQLKKGEEYTKEQNT